MIQTSAIPKRADYGIDAPGVVLGQAFGGLVGLLLGPALYFLLNGAQNDARPTTIAVVLLNFGIWGGLCRLLSAAFMVWSSKVGKLRQRDRLLDAIPLRG